MREMSLASGMLRPQAVTPGTLMAHAMIDIDELAQAKTSLTTWSDSP
jgi:hypothetical protein